MELQSYLHDPCGLSSLPWWKRACTPPAGVQVVHDRNFDSLQWGGGRERRFFRLRHDLKALPQAAVSADIQIRPLAEEDIPALAAQINASYFHMRITVTEREVRSWLHRPVCCTDLWLGAFCDGLLAGSLVCDLDREIGEGIVEWLQVLPLYRGRGIGRALLCQGLRILAERAAFVTVSGDCGNETNPERLYRSCGFTGRDVWHVITQA